MTEDEIWDQKCIRHSAWNRAQEAFIENGLALDVKWKRCVVSGNMGYMDDDCWTMLIAANPA